MPIYEYACERCGKEFEVQQRITEDPLTEHEGCGGAVRRLISLTAFSLRGDGWYSDHYGLKKNDGGSAASAKNGTKNGGSTEGAKEKGEAKKETPAVPKPEAKAKPDSTTSSAGTGA